MINLDDIITWIENRLDIYISAEDVAKYSGYSSRHLYSEFKKRTNVSLANYIRLRKLTQASYLIRQSGRSITDIILMYGFDSLQHFSRLFKRHFNISPTEYRKANSWDMSLFFPSALVYEFRHDINIIDKISKYIIVDHEESILVDYGHNFLLTTTQDGKIMTSIHLQDYYRKMFNDILLQSKEFTIMGNIIPVKGMDSKLITYTGKLSNDNSLDDAGITIPPVKYICFMYTGSLKDIIAFQTWIMGYGLYKYKCQLMRGPTFSTIKSSNEPDIFCNYSYVPIL
ncbi:helix-turn-helix transcriptional regulator [Escherichia coli]|nr:helix-turn-helix transcriptional regulator [Escherichia coli]EIC8564253.1 helix-turn-helix transcriptional regulator [Escherichia coli]EMB1662702.1 helix-turn-helix transcriptional regulator [Escherichia coli]